MHDRQNLNRLIAYSVDKDVVGMNNRLAGARNPARSEEVRVSGKPLRRLFDSVLHTFSSAGISLRDEVDDPGQIA